MTMKMKAQKVFAILLTLVMCIGLIPMFTITANAKDEGKDTNTYHSINHVDIAKDDGATELAVPSSATVIVTYANGDTKTLTRTGQSTGNDGASQWRFTGLKSGSYIGTANKTIDASGACRAVSVYISYVANGKTYEYTLSNYDGLYAGIVNCPGREGLDIAVLGSNKIDYYYYQVVYEFYTDDNKDGTESGNIQQVENTSVTLTPDASKTYSENTYTFDSTKSDNYTNVSLAASKNSPNNPIIIKLVYVRTLPVPQTGSLKVSKTISGENPDETKEFTFTVTATDANGRALEGPYGDMTFKDGNAIFTLKHGESKTATNIPVGTRYTVEEAEDEDYTSESTGASGTIAANETIEAAFVNTLVEVVIPQTGSLKVSKTVSGEKADETKEFTFTVTAADANGRALEGLYGDMTFKDGNAIFTLKHGESKTATDIPVGTRYTVEEAEDEDYTSESTGASGTIAANETIEAAFVNTLVEVVIPQTGSLKVSKTVSGEKADETKEFTFTVTAADANGRAIEGTYGDMTFKDGKAIFTLKHGESKTASDLPIGTVYSVTESDNDGYTVTINGENIVKAEGVVKDDTVATIAFNNQKVSTPDKEEDKTNDNTPNTGDESGIVLWGVIACVALLGIATLVFGKKLFKR